MNVKRIGGLALALAALLLVAGAAQAVVIEGKGELSAAGNGLAVLDFRGQANVAGFGLAIVEEDDIVHLVGHGRITPLENGRVLLEGFGRVIVRSLDDRTRVEIAGAKLRLRARGVGIAILKGVGHYMTDDLEGAWNDDQVLNFEEGDAE